MTAMVAPLEFCADLHCEIDSCPLLIRSAGRTIVVEVPDVATGLKLFQLGLPRGSRRRRLSAWKQSLEACLATVEVRVGGASLFRLGHDANGRIWRVVGLPALDVQILKLFSVWFRSAVGRILS